MQRYLTLVVLFVLAIPVGISIQGCANKNADYCNGQGYGYKNDQLVAITLQPQTTGLSVAYSQEAQLGAVSATNCKGGKGLRQQATPTARPIAQSPMFLPPAGSAAAHGISQLRESPPTPPASRRIRRGSLT